ncbi:peptidoglycan recognition protein family protein [Tautonia rosea]|uniref:peptidoglycan recognition protein family protein n=1 Tax=Tautonia rosea TaxID=2728037 RepID=UPI0014741B33|nr:peptidoglycan recognition family protein [Tautonia rosea]
MDARWQTLRMSRLTRLMVFGLAIGMVTMAGCKHRRSSYRPTFINSEPVLMSPTPSSSTVIPTDPTPYEYEFDAAPPSSVPPAYEDTYGPYVSPPASPGPANEPELNLSPLEEDEPLPQPSKGSTIPSDVGEPPRVLPPQTRNESGRTATRISARSDLRSKVQAMADDPLDLVQPPRADRPWRYIVVHHSASEAGGYAQIDREHRERAGLDGCSYHFIIGNGTESQDGMIEVTRRWSDQKPGAHCRDAKHPSVNEYGIGICLVGDLDATRPTPKQIEAARTLVAYLQERYAIPGDRVGSHGGFSATPTVCPGAHFPDEAIFGRPSLAAAR